MVLFSRVYSAVRGLCDVAERARSGIASLLAKGDGFASAPGQTRGGSDFGKQRSLPERKPGRDCETHRLSVAAVTRQRGAVSQCVKCGRKRPYGRPCCVRQQICCYGEQEGKTLSLESPGR